MEVLFDLGLGATAWLQTNFAQLDRLFNFVSLLNRFEFYLLLLLLIYWCGDKTLGKHLMYIVSVGITAVMLLKHLLRGPRPYWLDPNLATETVSEGYGFPSGHVFLAVTTFLFIAIWVTKNRFLITGCVVFIVLTVMSRMYLADHFPHDVVGGLLIGGLALVGYWIWMVQWHDQFSQRIMGQRFWVVLLLPIAVYVVYTAVLYFVPFSPSNIQGGEALGYAAEVVGYEDVVLATAVWLGLGIGFIFERSRVRFRVDGTWVMRAGRYMLGGVFVVGVQFGARALFGQIWPVESGLIFALVLRFVRYYLVAILAVYYVPMLYVFLGLAHADPEKQIVGSLNKLKQNYR